MIEYSSDVFQDPGKSTTIYTLDIETTSLFRFPDGSYRVFDYSKPPEFYQGVDKIALPYIWMLGVNDTVYYGRDFRQLEEVFRILADKERKKIIWVHNLSFEFTFLQDIFDKYTVENMIARTVRKPIAFTIPEFNIQFRCTYMLTNLSLEKAAERYTDVRKKSGDLDYNKCRTPRTELTETELGYCEYDIITLYNVVRYFRNYYKRLSWIPYTQTGEVRKAFRKRVNYGYIMKIRKRIPDDIMYLKFNKAFQGGMTHPNTLYAGKTLEEGVPSYDIASSYPTVMCLPIYPVGKYLPISPKYVDKLSRKNWCMLLHVKYYGIKAAKLNKYILGSKIIKQPDETKKGNEYNRYFDAGRLVRGDLVEMYLTDIDYDIIKEAYTYERCDILEAYSAVKGYLPKELIQFILELYGNKTKLKGVKGQEDFYMKQKQMLNSLFGCSCTNVLKSGCEYVNGEWITPELTPEYVHKKLEELRESKTNCFLYPWGCVTTAAARARLWKVISRFDYRVVYYDTDSIKYRDSVEVDKFIEEENKEILQQLRETCGHFNLDPELIAPLDNEGVPRPLGVWEKETKSYAVKFRTLGPKRYCYQTRDGKLHTVISGVGKKGAEALKGDIEKFTDDLVFDYGAAGKLISCYNDDQTRACIVDYTGKMFISNQKHGVALQPTTYNMSLTEAYEAYIKEMQEGFKGGEWIS